MQANQDFKYAMEDLTKIQIGAKYSYDEIIGNENISYKFRSICRQVFEQEVAPETTVESHLYYLDRNSRSYEAYKKLKTQVTVLVVDGARVQEDGSPQYRQRVLKIQDLALLSPVQKEKMGMVVQEIEVSKLGLTMFVV